MHWTARAVPCLILSSCWLGALEPDALRPYLHVLQRGGRRAPTPLPHHAVDSGPHFITLGVKVLSTICRPPTLPINHLRQAHGTAAQAERRRRGACFPSMINAVCSSADAAQDFADQRASSSRAASTRRKFSASLQGPAGFFFFASRAYSSRAASTRRKFSASLHGPAGFFFASSLDTTQVQIKKRAQARSKTSKQSARRATAGLRHHKESMSAINIDLRMSSPENSLSARSLASWLQAPITSARCTRRWAYAGNLCAKGRCLCSSARWRHWLPYERSRDGNGRLLMHDVCSQMAESGKLAFPARPSTSWLQAPNASARCTRKGAYAAGFSYSRALFPSPIAGARD